MKRCYKCGQVKPLLAFTKNRTRRDGVQAECRECRKIAASLYWGTHKVERAAYQVTYYVKHKEQCEETKRRYRKTPKGRATLKAIKTAYRINYPLKEQCHSQFYHAITAGKIARQPCINGCEGKAEGHHSDYTKPFDVLWLCRPCHNAWHAANK